MIRKLPADRPAKPATKSGNPALPNLRLDLLLCERNIFPSRAKAQAAIAAGLVRVGGIVMLRAATLCAIDAEIDAQPAFPWVSRAGVKLEAGLDAFSIDPSGLVCLDIGTSTGGFAQVLRARGAIRVYGVDVGHDQLHPDLRADPGIVSREGCDARSLKAAMFDPLPDIITCDASFIGLEKILPAALDLVTPGARLIALFKPQFELGRRFVGKGGIVRTGIPENDRAAEAALSRVLDFLSARGWRCLGNVPSPIRGTDGNREILIGAAKM